VMASPSIFCEAPEGTLIAVGIMFIERGNCTFYQKARNAMAAGATGVVIANTLAMVATEPDYPIRMGYPLTENPSAITIPVVSITARDFVLIQKVLLASNQTLSVSLEQLPGTGGGGHPGTPTTPPNSNPTNPNSGNNGNGNDNPEEPRHGEGRRGGHRRSFIMNGFIVSAIVISSCLCGFCCGRRCGSGRSWCRRQQAAAAAARNGVTAPVEIAVPVQSTVHGGERYVQVDNAAPVAYYGEQEMAPIPSAPMYEAGVAPSSSSMPNSAPSHYA